MKTLKNYEFRPAGWCAAAALLLACSLGLSADEKKPAVKAPVKAAPRAPAAAGRGGAPAAGGRGGVSAPTGRGGATNNFNRGGAPGGNRPNSVAGREQPRGATVERRNGAEISRRPGGGVREAHFDRPGGGRMDVHHGIGGGRRVEVERADHSRVFAERGGRGYVQRPYMYRGREFGHRTYYRNGRYYDHFYGRYEYRPGIFLDVYAPVRYYPAAFYGWAYNPWVTPVPYAWGWAGNPWYGVYGGYFTPYPVYASPSLWLTDYLISQSLAAAYQARLEAQQAPPPPQYQQPPPQGQYQQPPPQQQQFQSSQPGPGPGQVALTPEVKQMIADEVRLQVNLENAEAQSNSQNGDFNGQSSGIARLLADGARHVFVVGGDLDLLDASGQECPVSQGDVLQLSAPPPANAGSATLVVMSNQGGTECRAGSNVTVPFTDLQAMQNHMRETVDQGLADMQARKTGGLPPPPPSALAMPTPATFSMGAPPPDQTAAAEINQQYQEADKAEQQTLAAPAAGGVAPLGAPAAPAPPAAPAGPPPVIGLNMTPEQVIAIKGQPSGVVDLGAKKIYTFGAEKYIFQNGKLSDVQ